MVLTMCSKFVTRRLIEGMYDSCLMVYTVFFNGEVNFLCECIGTGTCTGMNLEAREYLMCMSSMHLPLTFFSIRSTCTLKCVWWIIWLYLYSISGESFRVIVETEEQVEISFLRTWNPSLEGKYIPLNIDKRSIIFRYVVSLLTGNRSREETFIDMMFLTFRFIMLRGSSGVYTYGIYEHLKEWPGFELGETRIAFKLRKDK